MSLSKQQFVRNSLWTFLELTLYPVLMIVATPVFISKLGIEKYGLWMLINTITLGMNVLNIGVGDTNIRLISQYRANQNTAMIRRVFNYNFSLAIFLCLSSALLGILFYSFNFISVFYKTEDYHFANSILLLASFSTGLKFVETSVISVFKAFERFDLSSRLVLLSKNSVMVLNLALVLTGHDLIMIFISTIVLNLVNVCLQLAILQNHEHGLVTFPAFAFFREKLVELNYNLWYWIQSSVALVGFLTDKLLVAYFTDIKTLGYYSIASLVGSQIHNFFLSFGSFIFPRVSFKLAENKDVMRIYFISRAIIALLGWTITSLLIVFGDAVFRIWLGPETFENSIYFIKLYLVFESGMLLIIVPFYFINGTSQIKLNSVFEIIIRGSHFIAMILGYYLSGVNGLVYGLILSTFLNIPFQYHYFQRRVLPETGALQHLLVIFPVLFLLALIFAGNVFFQLSLIIGFILSCKLIYFDTAKQYSQGAFTYKGLFGKLENK